MPDYMFLLESRLSPEQRAALVRVQELAQWMEANVYLAGGAVRDLITGMPIRDLDLSLEGNPSRMLRELEKGGARVMEEQEHLRSAEVVFSGDVDGSISAARDEVYARPGTKPEIRWATIMEDLRRRDFSINAIAISLNPASRGLLLDPTNGLADLERHEVRALSIHAFTNQPVRLLRILRYVARLGYKMESRTAEWFALARERGLEELIEGPDVGQEMRQLAREDNPPSVLKLWDKHELLGVIHPSLPRRKPDYEGLARLIRSRDAMLESGLRARLFAPVTHYLLARLKSREAAATLRRFALARPEEQAVANLEDEAAKFVKLLRSRKTAAPRDAFSCLEKTPRDLLAFVQTQRIPGKVLGKIRTYLHKWKPLRAALPAAELDSLGIPRGPKFDKILEDLFDLQLRGKGRNLLDRTRFLRQLAGIKPEPKKKPKEEKKIREKLGAKASESKVLPKKPEAAAPGSPAPPKPPVAPAKQRAVVPHPPAKKSARPAGKGSRRRAKAHRKPAKPRKRR